VADEEYDVGYNTPENGHGHFAKAHASGIQFVRNAFLYGAIWEGLRGMAVADREERKSGD
jgi:hypothetical protein